MSQGELLFLIFSESFLEKLKAYITVIALCMKMIKFQFFQQIQQIFIECLMCNKHCSRC